jgi:tRNA pseudouridine13 synthase
MFGDKMRRPTEGSPAAEREAAILAASGLAEGAFGAVRALAEGTRREATIEVADATVTEGPEGGTFEVAFALPGGAYATAVMREVMKTVPQRVDDTPEGA